uniref:Uncharacterized protein n=1 Tax=Globodera rostochiensis TaxID=31243 RepID=A0A914I233_GLORO
MFSILVAFLCFCLLLPLNAMPISGEAAIRAVRAMPPKYLGIRGYENCTQTKDAGGWASLCLPGGQKLHCSDDAWKQLNRLGQNERFPSC